MFRGSRKYPVKAIYVGLFGIASFWTCMWIKFETCISMDTAVKVNQGFKMLPFQNCKNILKYFSFYLESFYWDASVIRVSFSCN